MNTGLDKLKLSDFCRTNQERHALVAAADLPRFADVLAQPLADPVAVTLVGTESVQADGTLLQQLHLTALARATLQCQRCLEAFELELALDAKFVLVDDEAAEQAWDELHADDDFDADAVPEPLIASAAFNALALIEDELLLSLPLVPRHEVCPKELVPGLLGAGVDSAHDIGEGAAAVEEAVQAKVSPFAALAALKKQAN